MGIIDKIKGEFIDIIEWPNNDKDTIVWHFPRYQNELKLGAKLIVRESQVAVFINKGTIADLFTPGMYTLQTNNLPILSTLNGWKYGFNSPFKADIFFINTCQFVDQKWGTKNPIIIDDKRFGMIEIRAFGTFTFQVNDPKLFIRKIAGTTAHFSKEDIGGQLKSLIVAKFSDAIGEENIPVEKFAANLDELSQIGQTRIETEFANFGLKINRFFIENISMPDQLKKEIFEYSRLEKIDMQKLTQFKTAVSIDKAAENQNNSMGMGLGMAMGFGVGGTMAETYQQSVKSQSFTEDSKSPPPVPSNSYYIVIDGAQNGPFTIEHLTQLASQGKFKRDTLAWKNGLIDWQKAELITDFSEIFSSIPPPLP